MDPDKHQHTVIVGGGFGGISAAKNLRVFVEWIWYYFTFKRGVRLITDRLECEHCEQTAASTDKIPALTDD